MILQLFYENRNFVRLWLDKSPTLKIPNDTRWTSVNSQHLEKIFFLFNEVEHPNEIFHFLGVKKINYNKDPLVWWNENKIALPQLAEFARTVLRVPASTAELERSFSILINIATPGRSSLEPTQKISDLWLQKMFANFEEKNVTIKEKKKMRALKVLKEMNFFLNNMLFNK
jgi:hypothetical protein